MTTRKRWIPWTIAFLMTVALAATVPLAFKKPAVIERVIEKQIQIPVEVVKTVTNTLAITNTVNVTNEIPVTVEKIVEVPAEIPQAYKIYEIIATNYIGARISTNAYDSLSGISAVKVNVDLGSAFQRVISDDSARAKFELKLRQSGVPVSESSTVWVSLALSGMWDDLQHVTLTYSIRTSLMELQTVSRDDAFHKIVVTSWNNGAFGFAGRSVAPDAITKAIEEQAEVFATAYLRANSEWLATKRQAERSRVSPTVASLAPPTGTAQPIGFGTGFFVTEDGYLLSNYHVVKGSKTVFAKCGSSMLPAKLVSVDSQNDLALLKVTGKFTPLPLIPSKDMSLGSSVFTLGYPNPELQGISPKLTKGEISSLTGIRDDPTEFQISVPLQPGNSGGPLVDTSGNVVGIVTARLSEAASLNSSGVLPQNVNYAIKSSFVTAFLEAQTGVSRHMEVTRKSPSKLEDVIKGVEPSIVMVVCY